MLGSLEKKQRELQKQSDDASKQISALVAADQKVRRCAIAPRKYAHLIFLRQKFVRAINDRLGNIETALKNVLPAVTQPSKFLSCTQIYSHGTQHLLLPVPKQIADVTDEHGKEYKEKRETAASSNPMYNTDDLM